MDLVDADATPRQVTEQSGNPHQDGISDGTASAAPGMR
jgi:hypothetical protein